MSYQVKTFDRLKDVQDLSEELVSAHLALYEGYVKNTNKLVEFLDTKDPQTVEYSELQRRFGWEFNGMRLHELYFENLRSSSDFNPESKIGKKIIEIYGDFTKWQNNFSLVGAMRGIGWAVLYYDEDSSELFNVWVNEHDTGHLAGCKPLLVMDVFEHAYLKDFGSKKADYISVFVKNINWEEVESRFNK